MASEAEKTFHRFAVFGDTSSSGTEITNKNFSKLCKDCGIMDGKAVTSTDVDIVFSKVKAKNARTINFQQFQEAMKELGQKRFKGKSLDEALENVYKLMEGKDPATTGVTCCGLCTLEAGLGTEALWHWLDQKNSSGYREIRCPFPQQNPPVSGVDGSVRVPAHSCVWTSGSSAMSEAAQAIPACALGL
nr:tubulin polymerization-promoting protein family member 2 isoform X1 [Peromyscus maniculatus bairdii]XP_042140772.1 tubulin polymerization-promoting protein family member 2 isoform X1 [Peromyscus maniculatus bairdii]